jgi:hypothetical protein
MLVDNIENAKTAIEKPLRFIKFAFTPLALIFLFIVGWHSRDILSVVFEQAITSYFVLAILIWMISHLIAPIFSLIVFSTTNPNITYSLALSTHVGRLPARYLPGGLWHTIARIADFHSYGVNPKQLAAYVILENAIALGVAFTIGGTIVAWHQEAGIWNTISLLAAAGGLLGLAFCPFIINRWVIGKQTQLSLGTYLQAIGIAIVYWIVTSIAFILFLSAFPGSAQTSSVIETAGAYLFSWGVGYIAIFAPQGLGIFEAVTSNILQTSLSIGALAFLIAAFRLVILIADFASWGTLFFAKRVFFSPTHSTRDE